MNLEKMFPAFRTRRGDAFTDLRNEISRVFDNFHGVTASADPLNLNENGMYSIQPSLDISETEKAIEIIVDMPGVQEADIDVNLDRTLLTIKGSRSEEKSDENKDYKVTERSAGTFVRAINLPFEPGDGNVNGTLDNGVLTLVIEKPANEVANARKIPIASAKQESAAA